MSLPLQLDVIITQELLLRSGNYTEPGDCPLANCIKDALRGSLKGQILIDVGIKNVNVFCSEGLHTYSLERPYSSIEHELISHDNAIFRTTATLISNDPRIVMTEEVEVEPIAYN